ncbi:hypothetical protein EHYA_10413 [Embleya hyalina]|uniref:Uncharacterized protein n=1 Tax=Embleya hyalina TaxID=516124 RepID=A0A401Z727_9ACTN|nr:hypothetical protein EHYA_10413 [Embleya hyalina]
MAPVTNTVPAGAKANGSPAAVLTLTNRGTRNRPSRTASCGSVEARTAGQAATDAASSSKSTSAHRSECSDWAERNSPHTAAPARSDTRSSDSAATSAVATSAVTAPEVTTTRRVVSRRGSASQSCVRANMSASTCRVRSIGAAESAGTPSTTTSSGPDAASSAASATLRYTGTFACAATSRASGPESTAPTTAQRTAAPGSSIDIGRQSTRNSESRGGTPARRSRSPDTGRTVNARIDPTGSPAASLNHTDTASGPVGASRTRSRPAPGVSSRTPRQENTIRAWSRAASAAGSAPSACRAASNSAGCTS